MVVRCRPGTPVHNKESWVPGLAFARPGHEIGVRCNSGVSYAFRIAAAAPVPAIRPNTAPDIRPEPPG
jgi:hypothetical protein